MKLKTRRSVLVLATGVAFAGAAAAHVTLEVPAAPAGTSYKAVLRVGHACEGARTTTGLTVRLPAGFRGAKPMPKAGWRIALRRERLAEPYDNHGAKVDSDVVEISWTAERPENALPADFYDEFVLRGQLPAMAGPLWFKVLQTCDVGAIDWSQVPDSGTRTRGLKAPAALLDVTAPADGPHHH